MPGRVPLLPWALLLAASCGAPEREEGPFAPSGGPATGQSATSTSGTGTDPATTATTSSGGPSTGASDTSPKFDVGAGSTGPGGGGDGGGEGCARIDLLFVMDISASMQEEKQNLAANFDAFVQVLDDHVAANNGFSGYRIGVTNSSVNRTINGCTTTMGFEGRLFDGNGGCGLGADPWIEGPSPDAKNQFACLAIDPIPAGGGTDCGHEVPLEVIEKFGAELAPGKANEGFYDKDANSLLVVVIPTDEDEDPASLSNPAQAKAFLDQLAGGEDRYGVVVIAGPGPGDCMGAFGDAIYAEKLQAFANLVPNGFFGSICQGDLAQTLATALEDMVVTCEALPPPEG